MAFLLGKSFESCDLILAALFLWITRFFTARSAREMAKVIFSLALPFLAARMAISSFFMMILLTAPFLRLLLRALFAVFVTGMSICT